MHSRRTGDNQGRSCVRGVCVMAWISRLYTDPGGQYLSQSEMENNAVEFATYGSHQGFSIISMAGMLGCIQSESTINPGAQNLGEPVATRGLGLCQWTGTRHTALQNWCSSQGYDGWWYGPPQMQFMQYELTTYSYHMYDTHAQAIVPSEFRFSNGMQMARCNDPDWTLEMSTAWWLDCFEMGGGAYSDALWNQWWSTRWPQAQAWYAFLSGQPWPGRGLPAWMLRRIMAQSEVKRRMLRR